MKTVVIYKSRYGAAEQYARWIAESLNVKAMKNDEVSESNLKDADVVIAGSAIYMGKILLKSWLEKNAGVLQNKTLLLFIVGATPPKEKSKTEQYFRNNVPAALQSNCRYYYLQGKSYYKELSWPDKFLLKLGARFAPTEEEKKAMLTDFNAIRRQNLENLLSDLALVN